MGGKWVKNGRNYRFITVPMSPIFLEVEDLAHSSLCKNPLAALTDGIPLPDPHRHSGQCGRVCERVDGGQGRCLRWNPGLRRTAYGEGRESCTGKQYPTASAAVGASGAA